MAGLAARLTCLAARLAGLVARLAGLVAMLAGLVARLAGIMNILNWHADHMSTGRLQRSVDLASW